MLQSKFQFETGDLYSKIAKLQKLKDVDVQEELEFLESRLPRQIPLEQVVIAIGATWIPLACYEQFCLEVLNLQVKIYYCALVHEWDVRIKQNKYTGQLDNSPENYDWGWFCLNAHDYYRVSGFPAIAKTMNKGLFTLALTQQLPQVKIQEFMNAPSVVDPGFTKIAIVKQNQLKAQFAHWCIRDSRRAARLVEIYNTRFNRIVLPQWKGSGAHLREALKLTGISPSWLKKLRNYQLDAIWRFSLEGGINALQVGMGKTAIACGVVMLRKQYSTCTKALVIVQRSTLNQFYDTFLEMYPDAKLLCLTPEEFTVDLRQNQLAKIAYLPWDAVIMSHDSFALIPLASGVQQKALNEGLEDLENEMVKLYMEGQTELSIAKTRGNEILKRLDRERVRLRDRLAQLAIEPKIMGLTWEDLGFDLMLVDEIQRYKNNLVVSKLTKRVAGLGVKPAERSLDFDLKIKTLRDQWIKEKKTPFIGLVGMTGTPEPTNAMPGVYVFQKYFQLEELQERGIANFDAWIANFGEIKPCLEPKMDGSWRVTERLTNFVNVAELANLWFAAVHYLRYEEVTEDFTDADQRPTPKYITITNRMSAFQKEKMQQIADRYNSLKNHHPRLIPATDKAGYLLNPQGLHLAHPQTGELMRDSKLAQSLNLDLDYRVDNFLLLSGESRKLIIAPQLIRSDLPVDSQSKLFKLASCVLRIHQETIKHRLTQLVFYDIGTPTGNSGFNIYQWFRRFWVERGIPNQQIAFIQDFNTPGEREILFQGFNRGEIRILIASSEAGGIGVNVQQRLKAIHHGDLCYRPDQLEQREGRGVRQGNINTEVEIYRYITQGSKGKHGADTVMLQFLQNKQLTRDRFFNADPGLRVLQEADTNAELYMLLKAESTGDERIVRYTEIEIELEEKAAELSLAKTELSRIEGQGSGSVAEVERAIARCLNYNHFLKHQREVMEAFEAHSPQGSFSFCFANGQLLIEHQQDLHTKRLKSLYGNYHPRVKLKKLTPLEARRYIGGKIQEALLELDYVIDNQREDVFERHEVGNFKGLILYALAYGNGNFALWFQGDNSSENIHRYEIRYRKTVSLLLEEMEKATKTAFDSNFDNQKLLEQSQQRLGQLTTKKTTVVKAIADCQSAVNHLEKVKLELQEILGIEDQSH
jgi:hypothetical protein